MAMVSLAHGGQYVKAMTELVRRNFSLSSEVKHGHSSNIYSLCRLALVSEFGYSSLKIVKKS